MEYVSSLQALTPTWSNGLAQRAKEVSSSGDGKGKQQSLSKVSSIIARRARGTITSSGDAIAAARLERLGAKLLRDRPVLTKDESKALLLGSSGHKSKMGLVQLAGLVSTSPKLALAALILLDRLVLDEDVDLPQITKDSLVSAFAEAGVSVLAAELRLDQHVFAASSSTHPGRAAAFRIVQGLAGSDEDETGNFDTASISTAFRNDHLAVDAYLAWVRQGSTYLTHQAAGQEQHVLPQRASEEVTQTSVDGHSGLEMLPEDPEEGSAMAPTGSDSGDTSNIVGGHRLPQAWDELSIASEHDMSEDETDELLDDTASQSLSRSSPRSSNNMFARLNLADQHTVKSNASVISDTSSIQTSQVHIKPQPVVVKEEPKPHVDPHAWAVGQVESTYRHASRQDLVRAMEALNAERNSRREAEFRLTKDHLRELVIVQGVAQTMSEVTDKVALELARSVSQTSTSSMKSVHTIAEKSAAAEASKSSVALARRIEEFVKDGLDLKRCVDAHQWDEATAICLRCPYNLKTLLPSTLNGQDEASISDPTKILEIRAAKVFIQAKAHFAREVKASSMFAPTWLELFGPTELPPAPAPAQPPAAEAEPATREVSSSTSHGASSQSSATSEISSSVSEDFRAVLTRRLNDVVNVEPLEEADPASPLERARRLRDARSSRGRLCLALMQDAIRLLNKPADDVFLVKFFEKIAMAETPKDPISNHARLCAEEWVASNWLDGALAERTPWPKPSSEESSSTIFASILPGLLELEASNQNKIPLAAVLKRIIDPALLRASEELSATLDATIGLLRGVEMSGLLETTIHRDSFYSPLVERSFQETAFLVNLLHVRHQRVPSSLAPESNDPDIELELMKCKTRIGNLLGQIAAQVRARRGTAASPSIRKLVLQAGSMEATHPDSRLIALASDATTLLSRSSILCPDAKRQADEKEELEGQLTRLQQALVNAFTKASCVAAEERVTACLLGPRDPTTTLRIRKARKTSTKWPLVVVEMDEWALMCVEMTAAPMGTHLAAKLRAAMDAAAAARALQCLDEVMEEVRGDEELLRRVESMREAHRKFLATIGETGTPLDSEAGGSDPWAKVAQRLRLPAAPPS